VVGRSDWKSSRRVITTTSCLPMGHNTLPCSTISSKHSADNIMGYELAADVILVLHLLFIVFVIFGGLLCLYRACCTWLHLPAMIWGIWVEWAGRICPLTPLENHFRQLAFEQGYQWFHRALSCSAHLSATADHIIAMVFRRVYTID